MYIYIYTYNLHISILRVLGLVCKTVDSVQYGTLSNFTWLNCIKIVWIFPVFQFCTSNANEYPMHRNVRQKKRSLPFFCSPGSATLHGGINRDPGCRGEAGELTFQGEVQWWHVAMHQPRKRATGLGLKYLDVSSHLTHTVAYPKSDNPWMQLRLEIDQFKFGPFIIFSTQCWYSNNKPSRAPSHHHSYEWYKPSIWWVIYDIAVPTLRL